MCRTTSVRQSGDYPQNADFFTENSREPENRICCILLGVLLLELYKVPALENRAETNRRDDEKGPDD
jgi:hypothetical protein